MDRKKRKNTSNENMDENAEQNHVEIKGIIFIAVAVFMFCSLLGFNVGSIGSFTTKVLTYALGRVAFLLPLYLLVIGLGCAIKHEMIVLSKKFFSILLLLISLIGLLHYFMVPDGQEISPDLLPNGGGLLGGLLVFCLKKLLGNAGALIVLCAGILAGAVLTTKFSISSSVKKAGEGAKELSHTAVEKIQIAKERYQEHKAIYDQAKEDYDEEAPISPSYTDFVKEDPDDIVQPVFKFVEPPKVETVDTSVVDSSEKEENKEELKELPKALPKSQSSYKFPPLNLLQPLLKTKKAGTNDAVRAQSQIIEQTLIDFNVRATMVNVTKGPSVTRFELSPAPGVKLSKIQNLAEDLALKLAVPGIRIEPIPGKAAIGVEVPSVATEPVNFRAVVDCDVVKKAQGKLCVGLGKDISGNVIVADLSKMPHLLVAGSTGSGKSVCINTIIASLLFKAAPDEVKLILVDPKVVELTNYNGIPHLLTPVVTNAKKAASALHWAVVEMERRYTLFAEAQVRAIDKYNEITEEKLPFIVIIIDELADLMMVAAVDVEDAILRLAQKARAAGIHLILATQRPSVDVITGTIKANIPSRIAFAVSSQIDSRTILDEPGAEKLLGKGDMLFYPIGANKPIRIQGAFISDEELDKVVKYIKDQNIETEFSEEVTTQALKGDKKQDAQAAQGSSEDNNSDRDELFEDAVRLVMATQQASSSMLQRKFRIGYTRAARLVDTMEEMGIVGPQEGAKPRQLIMSNQTIEETFFTTKNEDGGELK